MGARRAVVDLRRPLGHCCTTLHRLCGLSPPCSGIPWVAMDHVGVRGAYQVARTRRATQENGGSQDRAQLFAHWAPVRVNGARLRCPQVVRQIRHGYSALSPVRPSGKVQRVTDRPVMGRVVVRPARAPSDQVEAVNLGYASLGATCVDDHPCRSQVCPPRCASGSQQRASDKEMPPCNGRKDSQ